MKITDDQLIDALCDNDVDFLENNKSLYDIDHIINEDEDDSLLLYSISNNETEVYDYLLKRGADRNAINNEGENILHSIIFAKKKERLIKVVKEYPDVLRHIDSQSKDGTTPLLLAILLDQHELTEELIKLGANVNLPDFENNYPIHMACSNGDLETVKLLVENKAQLNNKTNNGNYPIALAVSKDHFDIIRYLYPLLYGEK